MNATETPPSAGREQVKVGRFIGKPPSERPAFQPYRGKPAVRNDRGDRGDVGIIRSPVRASILPDLRPHPPEPRPAARQTHADASDEATESREAATTSETNIHPMWPPSTDDLMMICASSGYIISLRMTVTQEQHHRI